MYILRIFQWTCVLESIETVTGALSVWHRWWRELVDQAELHRKSRSNIVDEREEAVKQIRINFAELPDKEQVWADLHQLTKDEDSDVRHGAVLSLGQAFPHVPDKEQAWADLHQLTKDEDSDVRAGAVLSLGQAFPHVPDKEQAWADLHRLMMDKDYFVQRSATWSLGRSFSHVPDKEQAWADMIRLIKDKNSDVWLDAGRSLGQAFPHVPDKNQAWDDMLRLTQDEDSNVRVYANHSLGRATIFRATEAESEEEFRKGLETALAFFEKASTEATYINPSDFCFPFYRSFYAITFNKHEAKAEVQRYLAEVKKAAKGSENKELLLEAIENLANALTEAQRLREANLDTIKRNLNVYRQYCDHAADLICAAEEKTPGAARVLRRGLPIIDERIKLIISEIQEKARAVCKQTQGTLLEEHGEETSRYAQELSIQDPLALMRALNTMDGIARDCVNIFPRIKESTYVNNSRIRGIGSFQNRVQ